jgi:hypothetical protein
VTGELDPWGFTDLVADGHGRHTRWFRLIDEARAAAHPRDFSDGNGWVVKAFQAALVAVEGAADFRDAIHRAARGGRDTDTVAVIAGARAGARWGVSGIPPSWQRRTHGWPGYDTNDLARLAILAARSGESDRQGWPAGGSVLNPTSATPIRSVTPSTTVSGSALSPRSRTSRPRSRRSCRSAGSA